MKKDEFIAQLDRAASTLTWLPVTTSMLRFAAEQLKRGEPAWWKKTSAAWKERTFVDWTEAWGLFMTAVHYEALSDAENPLIAYFPSCGGTAEADPSPAFAKFLLDPPKSFYENLRFGQRRSYNRRCATFWVPAALLHFQTRRMPFYLVEVNAGGGVYLAADVVLPQKGFDSSLVAARIGLDARPLRLDDIGDRRWLTAGVMPEHAEGVAALDAAVDVSLDRLRRDPNFTQLVKCDAAEAARFVAKNIPADDPEVGLLLMNINCTARMADKEYAAYASSIVECMRAWGGRALWVEIEPVRGEMYSTTLEVRAVRLRAGAPDSAVLARYDIAGRARIRTPAELETFFALDPGAASGPA